MSEPYLRGLISSVCAIEGISEQIFALVGAGIHASCLLCPVANEGMAIVMKRRSSLVLCVWSLFLLHHRIGSTSEPTRYNSKAPARCESHVLLRILRGGGPETHPETTPSKAGNLPRARASGIKPPTVYTKPGVGGSPRFKHSQDLTDDEDAMSVSGRGSWEQQDDWESSTPRHGRTNNPAGYSSSQGQKTPGLYVNMDDSRAMDDASPIPRKQMSASRPTRNMKHYDDENEFHEQRRRAAQGQTRTSRTQATSRYPSSPPPSHHRTTSSRSATPPYMADSREKSSTDERYSREERRSTTGSDTDGDGRGSTMTPSRDPTQVCACVCVCMCVHMYGMCVHMYVQYTW